MQTGPDTDTPDIVVSIINYNSAGLTLRCVRSILDHTDPALRYTVVVLDNGSAPADSARLRELEQTPRVRVLYSPRNLGFAGGHMYAVTTLRRRPRYYFFLNNDTELLADALTALRRFADDHPDAALLGPAVYSADGAVQSGFDYFPTLATKLIGVGVLRWLRPDRYPPRRAYDHPLRVDVVSGCAMFVRADTFHAIGGFDTGFFLYCEEEDLAIRLHRAGHTAWVVPDARVRHLVGGSSPDTPALQREFFISFLRLYRKHYGKVRTLVLRWLLSVRLARKALGDPQKWPLAWFVWRGADPARSLRHTGGPWPME